jgi:hypothetical protein
MKIYSNKKRHVKASSDGWKSTDYSIFMNGKKQNFGKYTKDFDGYRVMILPEYNPKIDILSWVVYLFEGNEEPRKLEAFETSYDAQDFADYEVYEMYIKPITSSVKASYTYKYAVWVLDGDDNTWKVWSGKNSTDLGMSDDEFLDAINHPSFPNPEYNVDNNYVDVMVIDGDKTPADYGAIENIKDYPEYNGVDASTNRRKKAIKAGFWNTKQTDSGKTEYMYDIAPDNTFYFVDGTSVVWTNNANDPWIEYNGYLYNFNDAVDILWDEYVESCNDIGYQPTDDDFDHWVSIEQAESVLMDMQPFARVTYSNGDTHIAESL